MTAPTPCSSGYDYRPTLTVDDRVYIGTAGAYTLSYASNFNGFPAPAPLVVAGPHD